MLHRLRPSPHRLSMPGAPLMISPTPEQLVRLIALVRGEMEADNAEEGDGELLAYLEGNLPGRMPLPLVSSLKVGAPVGQGELL